MPAPPRCLRFSETAVRQLTKPLSRFCEIRTATSAASYRFDSEQDYVVVDVETTGSWSLGDRITEIGAVKIRNHQVVDEWHSLLNPQRPFRQR
jgi:DNA polymerase III subunit epsilon